MADAVLHRIPVVAGLAYIERVRPLPPTFTVTLVPEPDNRYFQKAIAIVSGGGKVGYLAPEISRRYFEPLVARGTAEPATCPGRRGSRADHESSGVEILLDFSALPLEAAE